MRPPTDHETTFRHVNYQTFLPGFDLAPYRFPDPHRAQEILGQVIRLGDRLRFTDLGQRLGLYVQLIAPSPRSALRSHHHDFLELAFILSGHATHTSNQISFPVGPGDILFQNHQIPHHFEVRPGDSPLILNLLFRPDVLQETLNLEKITGGIHFFLVEPFLRGTDGGKFRTVLAGDAFRRAATLGFLMVDAFTASFPKPSPVARHLFEAFLHLILEPEKRPKSPGSPDRRLELFRQILSEVDGRITTQSSIPDLARALGYRNTHISTTFKKHQGESIVQYIHRRRIEMATRALSETDQDIREIALEVGFQDVSHFNRVFKAICGVSPGQYRKMKDRPRGFEESA